MTVPKKIEVAGGSTIGSLQPTCAPFPSGNNSFSLNLSQTVQADVEGARTINSPVTWVDLLAGSGISSITYLALRVRNASSFELRFSSASGSDQMMAVSDLFHFASPTTGRGLTALSVRGSGDIEFQIAGL